MTLTRPHLALFAITLLAFALRFYQLGQTPPSLNLDEVAIGYNAYSILQTGMDEYGTRFPIAFRSHDDYKAPFYIYLTTLPIALLGLTEFAVRLPSALIGTLTIPLTYLLTQQLFSTKSKISHSSYFSYLPHLSAFLLAISPWHLQFSRAAFETNVAVFFVVLGIWTYLKGIDQPKYWFVTAISFAASIYTYHSNKLFIPAISLILAYHAFSTIKRHLKLTSLVFVTFTLIVAPLIPFMLSPEGQLRFKGTNVFNTPTLVDTNQEQLLDQWRQGREYQAKLFHSPYLAGLQVVLKGYFSHFSYDFLFHGESGPPKNHTTNVGLLYLWELPFIIIGLYALYHRQIPHRSILIAWLLLAPIASALTWDVPSSTRTTILLPTFQILTALGILNTLSNLKPTTQKIFTTTLSLIMLFFLGHYLHNYYHVSPKIHSDAWQYGYKQAVLASQKYSNSVDQIFVSTRLKQPQNFFAFYTKYDPHTYIEVDGGTVSGGFNETKNHFGNYRFTDITWDEKYMQPNTLYIDFANIPESRFKPLETINLLNGQPTIVLYKTGHELDS